MAKMRIYEIAKSLNMKSTELVKILNENGFEAKSPQSNIEDAAIAFILKKFSSPKKEADSEDAEAIHQEKREPERTQPPADKEKPEEAPVQKENVTIENREREAEDKKPMENSKPVLSEQEPVKAQEVKKEESESAKQTANEGASGNRQGQQGGYNQNRSSDSRQGQQGGYSQNRSSDSRQSQQGGYSQNRSSDSRQSQQGGYSQNRSSDSRQGQQGGYSQNRSSDSRQGQQGGYSQNRSSDSRQGQQGGYSQNRSSDSRQSQQGGYNQNRSSDSRQGQQGGYSQNRSSDSRQGQQGGYSQNRSSDSRQGQQGGYSQNRSSDSRQSQQGGYSQNRSSDSRQGQQGGYNQNRSSDSRQGQQGGYNQNRSSDSRQGQQGGYSQNRSSDSRQGQQGGYSQNRSSDNRQGQQGGYSQNRSGAPRKPGEGQRPGQQGGYNNNRGGFDRNGQNRPNFDKGGFSDRETQSTPLTKNPKGKNKSRNKDKDREKEIRREEMPKKDPNRKGAFIKPKPVVREEETKDSIKNIVLPEVMTIRELADKMKIPPAAIVKKLFLQGKLVSVNHEITYEEAEELALEYNCITEPEEKIDVIEELLKEDVEDENLMKKRPPVVCVMGHVDHGKTSLLDAIRETRVTEREAGGITQHIGAYVVNNNNETITFLDTPGHEAFTSMRMRGAKSTDIAILVVAADDGVMPQTVEAISHAKAAGVEIIVAINKIDKPSANIERVKQELVEHELIAEDWGGSTVFVPVSAKTGEGIDQLLEMISLTAEVLELKANPERKARGIVIEAQLDKGRGPVATILVQKGTLQVGDSIAIGSAYGKVRAMMDDTGRRLKEATPSTPVEILGLNEVPNAGEVFMATENDKEARSIAEAYIKQGREKLLDDTKAKLSLDGLFSQIQAGNIKELNIIVKADVQGSVEAVKQSLLKLNNDEVAIRIIHGGVGAVNESDVSLASASNAIIIGFNVRPDNMAKDMAEREKVDLRLYKVIYNAIEDIEAAMKGMLDPIFEEKVIGHGEIRQIFKASGLGTIAGSYVLDGKIVRNCSVRIFREGKLIHEGALASLKRFKDDVKEVAAGYECGLVFEKFNDFIELDQVEAYVMEEVPR